MRTDATSCGRVCGDGRCCKAFRVCVTPAEAAALGHDPSALFPCDENLVALPKKPDGSCIHQDPAGRCVVHDGSLPATCRHYLCEHDPRRLVDARADPPP